VNRQNGSSQEPTSFVTMPSPIGNTESWGKSSAADQKRVIGEMFGGRDIQTLLPNATQLARMQGTGTRGIDDLYRVTGIPDVDYVVVEYKFVGNYNRTGADQLGRTRDGLQGSKSWILGENRLEHAVGPVEARDVRRAIQEGRHETWAVTTRPDGSRGIQILDADGRVMPPSNSRILPPDMRY